MIPKSSKTFFRLGGGALIFAIVYGLASNTAETGVGNTLGGDGAVGAILGPLTFGYKGGVGDHYGYAILVGLAVVLFLIGGIGVALRDGTVDETVSAANTLTSTANAVRPVFWPVSAALACGLVMVGLAVNSLLFAVGLAAAVLVGAAWMLTCWTEMTTADASRATALRSQLVSPIELPLVALLVLGVIVFCVSRILVASSEITASIIAVALAAVVLAVAFVLASRPALSRSLVMVLVILATLVIVGLGIGGAVSGPAHVEHETGQAPNPSGMVVE